PHVRHQQCPSRAREPLHSSPRERETRSRRQRATRRSAAHVHRSAVEVALGRSDPADAHLHGRDPPRRPQQPEAPRRVASASTGSKKKIGARLRFFFAPGANLVCVPAMATLTHGSATAHPERHEAMRRVRAIVAGSSGNLVEWYDFYVYSFTALYFAAEFFPKGNQTTQLLQAAGVFAAGFFMRPVGSWLFGWLADKRGRSRRRTRP